MSQTEHERRIAQIRYRQIMERPEQRAWVWDLLAACGVYRQSFNSDPQVTSFNEGQRSIGLQILAGLQAHCHDLFQQMEQEQLQRSNDEI